MKYELLILTDHIFFELENNGDLYLIHHAKGRIRLLSISCSPQKGILPEKLVYIVKVAADPIWSIDMAKLIGIVATELNTKTIKNILKKIELNPFFWGIKNQIVFDSRFKFQEIKKDDYYIPIF